MKQYEISGEARVTPVQCSTCNNGDNLEFERVRYHKYASLIDERICGVCNTKYKAVREDAERLMDEHCGSCQHDGKCCQLQDKEIICSGNIDKFISTMEVSTMNEDLVKAKDEYQTTGICKKHDWVEEAFKTFEGRFTVKNCKICGTAISDYKGENIMGDIRAVTNYIISKGIAKEKISIEKKSVSDSMFSPAVLFDIQEDFTNMFGVKVEAVADKKKIVEPDFKLF